MTARLDRRRAILAAVTMMAGATVCTAAVPPFEIQEIRTISQQPRAYHGWPTLARCSSGELLLVCSGGREAHVCPFGRVELMRSRDGGQSWSWPRVVMDGPIDDRDAGVLETATGSILITTFTSLAYQNGLKKRPASWHAAHNRVSALQRQQEVGVWMIRSTDGGVTWSARIDCLVNSPHGPIQLADGRLLYAGKDLWRKNTRVAVCESTDDGQTWKWLADIPVRKGDDHRQYHELHAVETTGNHIVLQIRNHNETNEQETLQCESQDGGRTWTTPHPIGVWGLPSHLLRLRDDRLLMTYGHRRPPFGIQARLSANGGRTWSQPLVLSADGLGADLGYPSSVQLDDGTLVTVWYERMRDSPRAVLRQAKWSLRK